jgi:hypothetical protein
MGSKRNMIWKQASSADPAADGFAQGRTDEQQRRRLETRAGEWIERDRGTASLLDPVELSEAEQSIPGEATRELGFEAGLPALVARQRRKRMLRAFAVLTAISVAAWILGLLAWDQQRAAQHKAQAERLLDRGQVLLDEHPMQALAYPVAVRAAGMEVAVIRAAPVQALRKVPLVTLVGHSPVSPMRRSAPTARGWSRRAGTRRYGCGTR